MADSVEIPADKKDRLDRLVVDMGLAHTQSRAKALILAGRVKVDSRVVDKAGTLVKGGSKIEVAERGRYVGRGGEKLEHALKRFSLDPGGLIAADIGASTGGFTDCLLQHGASKVYAIDVGYGQLAWSLRQDPRVVTIERTNARELAPEMFDERPAFATVDVSFISLTLVLGPIANILADGGDIVALVKPQFEAARDHVGKGGVVRDPAVHNEVVQKVTDFADRLGLVSRGSVESPLLGPAGNKEFFVHFVKPQGGR